MNTEFFFDDGTVDSVHDYELYGIGFFDKPNDSPEVDKDCTTRYACDFLDQTRPWALTYQEQHRVYIGEE